jgi:DNA polymerase I
MLRLGLKNNQHFRTKWYDDELVETKFKGAYVMNPTCRGIVKNVHVCDFASLYPSIMISWNLGPDTKVDQTFDGPVATSPKTGVRTRVDRKSILATALESLLALRSEWNKKRASFAPGTPEAKDAERRTNAYKTAANSFYGVMGTPFSRYFDKEIAESTTQNGAWLIESTLDAARARGWDTIYADTDSAFVTGPNAAEFAEFVAWCNTELYPSLLTETGCVTNAIKLAYEKEFERIVFCAAKRYTGRYAHYKGKPARADSKPEVRGLEYRRGDVNRFARDLQSQAIALLMAGHETPEPFWELLNSFKVKIMTEHLEVADVVLSKSISKPIKEYKTRQRIDGGSTSRPAHVELAAQLAKSGADVGVGTRIEYVVVDASESPARVIPATEYTGECDRYWLWENMVYPPTRRLLESAFPDNDWSDWSKARPSRRFNPSQLTMFSPAVSLPPDVATGVS